MVFLVGVGACLNFKLPPPTDVLGGEDASMQDRAIALVSSLRVFRVLIAVWNCFVLLLLLVWFP